ncbi:threonine synthase [Phakopsora pachyrhizi]|nr:threonine synthase [Phakopsora pachyrhizi]
MRYLSTRGDVDRLTFEQFLLDLRLTLVSTVPESLPNLPVSWKSDWSSLSFQDLAIEIYGLFISDSEIGRVELRDLVVRSYSTFSDPQITPIRRLDHQLFILELWHGPTFAFKDVALQFLGNLFEFFLQRQNDRSTHQPRTSLTVLGATSGDTGSAAIYGLRAKRDISIYILHPHNRISPIQEAQMTTVTDRNVFNISLDGTFDDCQDIVKDLFNEPSFRSKHQLSAINSINWARILAQITYYFYSYLRLKESIPLEGKKLQFVVPTGNFGDILAGFYAMRLGLPISSGEAGVVGLVIATNSNDILTRFWETGRYEKIDSSRLSARNEGKDHVKEKEKEKGTEGLVKATLSPAMDILVSSNFERLLFYLIFDSLESSDTAGEREDQRIRKTQQEVNLMMNQLKETGRFEVSEQVLKIFREMFWAGRTDDQQTCEIIREYYYRETVDGRDDGGEMRIKSVGSNYLVDPHTAVGLNVAKRFKNLKSKLKLTQPSSDDQFKEKPNEV